MMALAIPETCMAAVERIVSVTGAEPDAAYRTMLLTAVMTDLHPEDDEVVNIILDGYSAMKVSA